MLPRLRQNTVLALIFVVTGNYGCVSDKMRDDIFNMQTRLLMIERKVDEGGEKSKSIGDNASKHLASTSVALEELTGEVQRIKGDIEMLKVAVPKGQLPTASSDDESVAKAIERLESRVTALEESEMKILNLLEKNEKGEKDKDKKGKSAGSYNTLPSIQAAFAKGRFKSIAEEVPAVLKQYKGEQLHEVKFLLAESLFKLGKMREAVLSYDELIKNKTPASKVPLMYLRVGDCFRHLGDKPTAMVYYKELVGGHPGTNEATKAQEHMKKLQ